ncbi:hypothetical protein SCREM1_39 [Synechococcus phage S-CREM1]|nr:hypothetical protein SCREM1_39 [Synechococcus phage S-CREM1]
MSFFNSEMVQDHLQSIYDTYMELYDKSEELATMPKEEALKHIGKTKELVEKQKIFYTRLQLSSSIDEDAADMKHRIDLISNMFGYNNLIDSLSSMEKYLDRVAADLDKTA